MALGLRKENVLRIEFEPADAKQAYQTSLKWAQWPPLGDPGNPGNATTTTNQAGEGQERKKAQGKAVVEKGSSPTSPRSAPGTATRQSAISPTTIARRSPPW